MSEDTKIPPAGDQSADQLKNLKAEMDRKLGNLEKSNQALVQQLQSMLQPKTEPTPKGKLEDVWFDRPEAAAAEIEERVMSRVAKREQTTIKTNATIGQLVSEFPELSDNNSDLTRKAVEIYSSFSDEDKSSPVAYRAAVREAAMELGVSPKSKRPASEDDNFSLSGGNSSGSRKEKAALDKQTLEFAAIMGLDTSDKKVVERIKSRQGRKWERYE